MMKKMYFSESERIQKENYLDLKEGDFYGEYIEVNSVLSDELNYTFTVVCNDGIKISVAAAQPVKKAIDAIEVEWLEYIISFHEEIEVSWEFEEVKYKGVVFFEDEGEGVRVSAESRSGVAGNHCFYNELMSFSDARIVLDRIVQNDYDITDKSILQ